MQILLSTAVTVKKWLQYTAETTKRTKKDRGGKNMDKYECTICGYIYDPEKGDPDSGIEPGTPFENLPDDWVCPVCGAAKEDFKKVK
jgi:rubredoxin